LTNKIFLDTSFILAFVNDELASYSKIPVKLYDFLWSTIRIIVPRFFAIILIAFQRESYQFIRILLYLWKIGLNRNRTGEQIMNATQQTITVFTELLTTQPTLFAQALQDLGKLE